MNRSGSLLRSAEVRWSKAMYSGGSPPARWWFSEEDWMELRAGIRSSTLHFVDITPNRLFGTPVSFDHFGQPSRLVLDNGEAIPLRETEREPEA